MFHHLTFPTALRSYIELHTHKHTHTLVLYSSSKGLLALIEVLYTLSPCGMEIILKRGAVERLEAQDVNPETACRF